MAAENGSGSGEPGGIQFEKAEYAGTSTPSTCTRCHQPLGVQYYELNGSAICSRCHAGIQRDVQGGFRLGRFLRATGLGLVAAGLGSALYYGVRALTGYEFGLVAILVGLAVGIAVKVGSRGRGGWAYQGLAMFLTYASIVSTYVPDIWQALRQQAQAKTDQTQTTGAPTTPAATPGVTPVSAPAPPVATDKTAEPVGVGRGLLALVVVGVLLMAIAFVAPFLAGIRNIMGLIIIGIGLYEAWKINKRTALVVTGPYRLGQMPRPAAGA
jgi:hypothetical protein